MFLLLLRSILCDSIDHTRRHSGYCYSHYTHNGCRTCVSRNETVKCGWCESMNICAEGTEEGPTEFYCGEGDWFFEPPMKCKKICAKATKEEECEAPCTWTKKGCMMASKLKVIKEAKQEQSEKVSDANHIFLTVGIVCGVVAIVAIGALVWKSKRPLYKELPLMNSVMKLDALPLANGMNANV